ncbi:MAG: EAL domain-containing protein [Paraglaciecola sp.]|nr:EAL domain-containing protein [Paraglaciecola sp.]
MFLPDIKLQNSKILIVDDNLQNVMILKEVIAEFGQVFFSSSGADALDLIPKVNPDLILLDIEMPSMDGWQVCRTLKQQARFADIPIIFITGHNQPSFEQLSLELGAVDFITKPFDAGTCKLRVRNQLKLQQQTRQIIQAREQIQHLVKQVPVLITYWNKDWQLEFSNDFSGSWFAVQDPSERQNNKHLKQFFPEALSSAIQHYERIDGNEKQFVVEVNEGKTKFYYQVFQTALTSRNEDKGYLVTIVDISEVKLAKDALYSEKERLRVTLSSIGDAVVATDIEGLITFMNPVAERLTGWRFRDARNLKIENVMPLRDAHSKHELKNPLYIALSEQRIVSMALNSQLISRYGASYLVEDSAAPIRDKNGEMIGAIMVFHDVSETMAMSVKMSHLANHDQLTDLPNRLLLRDRLDVACASATTNNQKACILLIDIDHFKYLNDTLGHQYGDELIIQVSKRLKALLPPAYTLSRLGGDEFVVLMSGIVTVDAASQLARRLLDAMHEPFMLAGNLHNASVSTGISLYPDDAQDAEQLMRHADAAMYRAKQEGRNRFCFFSDELEEALLQRHQLEKTLRHALKHDELVVLYQPKINMHNHQVVGAEALVRLPDGNGSFISPAEFIPLAEESGLIIELGRQVLFKACAYIKLLLDQGLRVPISVNVAAAQFSSAELELHIQEALTVNELPAELLELEITETALMVDVLNTQNKLAQLKALGIAISIDDFGTGYSSLSYLKKFNVDIMKIDMSFVRDMLINHHDFEIVKTIISLGQSMGLKLVAEGVETKEQQKALLELGCETGQGYLFSKPIAVEPFLTFLKS